MLGRVSNTNLQILSVSGVPQPPLYGFVFSAKKKLRIWGYPPPPLYGLSPKKILQKGLKIVFFFSLKKHLILVQKIGYGFWGYPPPPLYGFFFSEKGVTDLGGNPAPPFTDKIRKVVFDGFPMLLPKFYYVSNQSQEFY